MSTKLKLLSLCSVLVLTLAGCGAQDDNGGGAGNDEEGGGTELLVEAHDFRFEAEGVTLGEPGEETTVRLVNQGEAPHTFSSDEVDLAVEAGPGEEGEGSFTVPDDGTVDFQCDVHPDQMTLTLTSGEPASDSGSSDSEETEDSSETTTEEDTDY